MEQKEVDAAYQKGLAEGAARKEVEIVMRAYEAGLELGRLVLISGKTREEIEKLISENEA